MTVHACPRIPADHLTCYLSVVMSHEMKLIELNTDTVSRLVEIHITGKLEKADYEHLVPEIEMLIEQTGKIRLLVILSEFDGWTAGALWEDVKFDAKHFNDIERLAIVGGTKWEKGMATFCRPFTSAEVRYFVPENIDDARTWVLAPSERR